MVILISNNYNEVEKQFSLMSVKSGLDDSIYRVSFHSMSPTQRIRSIYWFGDGNTAHSFPRGTVA